MSALRRLSLVPVLALLAAPQAGCGVSASRPPAERGTEIAQTQVNPLISSRPPSAVLVDGSTLDALAPVAAPAFQSGGAGSVLFTHTSSDQAFTDLCDGRVDVVEPGSGITPKQTAACSRNHLDLIGPLAVGWDAVVIAVKNEADVGGDCLTTQQARDIFRAGSPYTNWSELGFDDVPLTTTGSLAEPVPAELFARAVLGEPSLTSAALRADFVPTPSLEATRRQIVGAGRASQAQAAVRRRLAQLHAQTQAERERLVKAAEKRADAGVLAQIAAVNERNRRLKTAVDAEALDRHNAQIDAAAKRAAAAAANAQIDAQLAERAAQSTAPLAARALTPGVVGFVRFTYYEQWEEQLRPFEIWAAPAASAPNGQLPNCVFPSAETVSSGHYPLAFGLVLYTTRQALERGVVRDWLTRLLSNAQAIDASTGLVPITDRQRETGLLAIGARLSTSASTPTQSGGTGASLVPRYAAPSAAAKPVGSTSAVPGVGAAVTPSTQSGSQ